MGGEADIVTIVQEQADDINDDFCTEHHSTTQLGATQLE
jgi:hypothetical protein